VIDGKEVLVLWSPVGEVAEFTITGASVPSYWIPEDDGKMPVSIHAPRPGANNVTLLYWQNEAGMQIVRFKDGMRVVLVDRAAAHRLWAPTLSNDPLAPVNDTGT